MLLRNITAWTSASILMVLPLLVALDYGGVLYWTQYVMALAVVVAFALTIPSLFGRENSRGLKQHLLLAVMVIWTAYAFFQTVPLPGPMVGLLSPASGEAYTSWIEPFFAPEEMPSLYPISVDRYSSRHAVALLWIFTAVVYTSAIVFDNRARMTALLASLAASAAIFAAIGIGRRLIPGFEMWSFADGVGNPFATFVNRNNAALFLNLGMACGLGLLAWRISALTGQDVDDPEFEYSDLISLTGDRQSIIGVLAVTFCGAGLLIGGSRGGVVAAVAGLLLAFGWVRQKRGVSTLAVVTVAMAIGIGVLTIPTDLSLDSIQRLDFNAQSNTSTILRNGRLDHWPDGMRTALAHLPAGSGLGTYGHAYLPHQESTTGGWFEHADNLWLELFVEQGVVGVLLLLAALGIIVWSLHDLNESGDAIDHGIRIAGWYIVGAVLFSQLFDFGLIIPASAIVIAILFPAILSRSVQASVLSDDPTTLKDGNIELEARSEKKKRKKKLLFERRRVKFASWMIPAALAAPVALSLPGLAHDATDRQLARSAIRDYAEVKSEPAALKQAAQALAQRHTDTGSPDVGRAASQYLTRLARYEEVEAAQPANDVQRQQFFARTSLRNRGLGDWNINPNPGSASQAAKNDNYDAVLSTAQLQLLNSPYSRLARWNEVQLDFAHQTQPRSKAAIDQLIQFYWADSRRLIELGREAIKIDHIDAAARSFRKAVILRPAWSRTIFGDVLQSDKLDFLSVLPPKPTAFRSIADLAVRQLTSAEPTLTNEQAGDIRGGLACEECRQLEETIKCLLLEARLSYAMADYDAAFKTYESIIESQPREARHRVEFVRRLVEQDERARARKQAIAARELFPEDRRFQAYIDEVNRRDQAEA